MLGPLNVANLIIWYLVFLFSTTFHEFAHAWLAYRGGDLTAYEGGQVSLDPVPHIRRSPFGMVIMPLLSFVYAGWMIGWASTPFDPRWARRHPRRHALMSLGGPLANLLLATIGVVVLIVLLRAGVYRIAYPATYAQLVTVVGEEGTRTPLSALGTALSVMVSLNVLLGLFNLLPVPPLDGAGVVEGFAPRTTGSLYDKFREVPMLQLGGLLIAWWIFPLIAQPAVQLVFRVIAF